MTDRPQASWCLRFLGGAAKGRTLALKRGANVLGSAPECDLMLAGGDARPRHLIIQVGDLAAAVQRIDDATLRINGDEMTQRRRSLVAGDVLAIGSLSLQFDRLYAAGGESDNSGFAESIMPGDEQTLLPGPVRARRQGPAYGRWIAATLMLLASAALAMTAAWSGLAEPKLLQRGPDAAAVQRAINAFAEVEMLALPQGQLLLRGYVESRARKLALDQAVLPFGRAVSVSVHAVDEIVEQARRYVADPAIAISYQGLGKLTVSGVADDPQLRKRIRQLAEDLQPAVLITDRVRYREDRVSAKREANRQAQWAAWQSELPARVVGITEDANGARHVQLANGSRYYEGALLRSGAELKHIDAQGIELGARSDERR